MVFRRADNTTSVAKPTDEVNGNGKRKAPHTLDLGSLARGIGYLEDKRELDALAKEGDKALLYELGQGGTIEGRLRG